MTYLVTRNGLLVYTYTCVLCVALNTAYLPPDLLRPSC